MQVRDVMTRNVISIAADEPVYKAARLMLQNRISGLPVIDAAGKLVGIVTEGDFLRRGELGTQRRRPRWLEFIVGPGKLADEYVRTSSRKVGEVMTPITSGRNGIGCLRAGSNRPSAASFFLRSSTSAIRAPRPAGASVSITNGCSGPLEATMPRRL